MAGSSESPLHLKALLKVLESDTSSDEQVLEAYTKISAHISKELSLFERDFVEQGQRLVAVTKKHVTSNREIKNSIASKALNVMGFCVNIKEIVSFLSTEEIIELLTVWNKTIAETKDKFACSYAFWCLNNQKFPADIMDTELPSLMNAFSRASISWWGMSTMVEYEAMHAIQRLGEQCPRVMIGLCSKWGPLYLRLLVSSSSQIRDHAFTRVQKWSNILASSSEFMRTGIPTVTKQIVPSLSTMFSNGLETFTLKTCMLFLRIFKLELQNISLINSLLSIQEMAFRCSSSDVRCQAFQSWEVLIDMLAEKGVLQKPKFVELIMRVFKTRNANTEEVAVAKLTTWWKYVQLMDSSVWMHFDPILRSLLQFCLGNARLGSDTGLSSLKSHDPSVDPAPVPMSPGVPGSLAVLPVFAKTQCKALDILVCLLQDGTYTTSSLDLEPLKSDSRMPLSVCIKNAKYLVAALVELTRLFAHTHESLLMYAWKRMTSYLLLAVEKDGDESNMAVSTFLTQFQALVSSEVLHSKMTMKLFEMVCSLPADVLSSPSLIDGSLFKCRAHSLCELLLASSALTECGKQESFMTVFMTLVRCGVKHPGSTLPFLESVGKLLDSRVGCVSGSEDLWRMWSFVASVLHEYISSANRVDQDDDLWPNFGCLYTILLLPVSHLLGPKLPLTSHKTAMKTWTELYHTFARLSAMVPTAEANIVVEELSQKILTKLTSDGFEKDPLTLEHVVELCHTMVETIDFSSLTTANPFMKGIRTTPSKHRSAVKALGNLHSVVSLMAQLVTWLLAQPQHGDQPKAGTQVSGEGTKVSGPCCVKLMDMLSMLVSCVTVSSLVSHMMEILTPSLAALFTAVPKKLPAKVCTPVVGQKVDRLWQDLCSMLQHQYKGQFDSELLHQLASLLQATFLHSRRLVKNQTVQLWNSTFGSASAPLTYPASLQSTLAKIRERTQLSLPGWTVMDVAVIDETPVSQMSQMDSEAPEPLLPGMPSPVHLRGSFLNKDVSPKPGTASSPKRAQLRSENRRSSSGARKRLPLESMPQKDFVVISTTPNKRRVLTEHQKEVLKEKRVMPAMYNNLEASQDVSLMAHFSSDNTQQDSLFEKPTVDDVIVVNSSQSQDLLEPKSMQCEDKVNSEALKSHLPRRSSRRSSVRFEGSNSAQDSNSSVSEKTSVNKPEIVNSSGSSSLDTLPKSGNQEPSFSFPTPQPNVLATSVEKLIDTSSSRETSQSVVSVSSQSSEEKKEKQGLDMPGFADRENSPSHLEKRSSSQSRSMDKASSAIKRRTRSQETKASPKLHASVIKDKKSPYDIFLNWFKKASSNDAKPQQSNLSEKKDSINSGNSKQEAETEKLPPNPVNILAEETKSPIESTTQAPTTNLTIQETPTKADDSSSSMMDRNTRSRSASIRRIKPIQLTDSSFQSTPPLSSKAPAPKAKFQWEDPEVCDQVISQEPLPSKAPAPKAKFQWETPEVCDEVVSQEPLPAKAPVLKAKFQWETPEVCDQVASQTSLPSKAPAPKAKFQWEVPVVCDEVASQGFPVGFDLSCSPDTMASIQNKAMNKIEDLGSKKRVQDRQEQGQLLSEPSMGLGFSGLLNNSQELEIESQTDDVSSQNHEEDISVDQETLDEEMFDPDVTGTLRSSPVPRRSSRRQTLDKSDADDSQNDSPLDNCSDNLSQSSQKQMSDSQSDFDPTKCPTLNETTEHTRKRKQNAPKKIADPSLLRRTPRKKMEKKSPCSCCKNKPGNQHHNRGSPGEKLGRKPGRKRTVLPEAKSPEPEKFLQNTIQSDEQVSICVEDSENNNAEKQPKKKLVNRSPQDIVETTPENKTNFTPLRFSTKERKKALKQKSVSKFLEPRLKTVSDSDDDQPASQSTPKPKKAKKDVFNSKKEQGKTVSADVYQSNTTSPTSSALRKCHIKPTLNVKASKLKLKRLGKQKSSMHVRSPPRLRLRKKEKTVSDQKHETSQKDQPEQETTMKTTDDDTCESPMSTKMSHPEQKSPALVLENQSQSNKVSTEKRNIEKDDNQKSKQKGKVASPVSPRQLRCSRRPGLSGNRHVKRLRGRVTRNELKKRNVSHLQADFSKVMIEEESEETKIELYDSHLSNTTDINQVHSQGDGSPMKSKVTVTTSSVCEDECQYPPSQSKTNVSAEEKEATAEARSEDTGFNLREHACDVMDSNMSMEKSEVVMVNEATLFSSVKEQGTHENNVDTINREGSEDMFQNDSCRESSVPVPFSENVDSNGQSLNKITKIVNSVPLSLTEECSEDDLPLNQRGLEDEVDSVQSVVEADQEDLNADMDKEDQKKITATVPEAERKDVAFVAEEPDQTDLTSTVVVQDDVKSAEEQENEKRAVVEVKEIRGDLSEQTQERDRAVLEGKNEESDVAKTEVVVNMANNLEENSHPTEDGNQEEKPEEIETSRKSLKRKLSKAELFEMIDQSDASAEEIINYLQMREKNKQLCQVSLPAQPTESSGTDRMRENRDEHDLQEKPSSGCSLQGSLSLFDDNSAVETPDPSSPTKQVDSENDFASDIPLKSSSDIDSVVPECSSHVTDLLSNTMLSKDVPSSTNTLECPLTITTAQDSLDASHDSSQEYSELPNTEQDNFNQVCSSIVDNLMASEESCLTENVANPVSSGVAPASDISTDAGSCTDSCASASSTAALSTNNHDTVTSQTSEQTDMDTVSQNSSCAVNWTNSLVTPPSSSLAQTSEDKREASYVQPESAASMASTANSAAELPNSNVSPQSSSASKRSINFESPQFSTPKSSRISLLQRVNFSPGILKRRRDESEDECTPSKSRRVSFANPVEDGGTPTCDKCAGIPSCGTCAPQGVRKSEQFQKTVDRVRKRRTLKQQGMGIIKRDGSKQIYVNKTSSPRSSVSQSPSSYHSTQESQLDNTKPVFPDLVGSTESYKTFITTLTSSIFGRGLESILLTKGLSSVGHLASLTQYQVEKLPIRAPKIETLTNALKYFQSLSTDTSFKPLATGDDKDEGASSSTSSSK